MIVVLILTCAELFLGAGSLVSRGVLMKEFEEQMVNSVHLIGVVVVNAISLFVSCREKLNGRVSFKLLAFHFVSMQVDLSYN